MRVRSCPFIWIGILKYYDGRRFLSCSPVFVPRTGFYIIHSINSDTTSLGSHEPNREIDPYLISSGPRMHPKTRVDAAPGGLFRRFRLSKRGLVVEVGMIRETVSIIATGQKATLHSAAADNAVSFIWISRELSRGARLVYGRLLRLKIAEELV